MFYVETQRRNLIISWGLPRPLCSQRQISPLHGMIVGGVADGTMVPVGVSVIVGERVGNGVKVGRGVRVGNGVQVGRGVRVGVSVGGKTCVGVTRISGG